MASTDAPNVTILGAGAIGCAFAATFLDAGADVVLVEPSDHARAPAPKRIEEQTRAIEVAGLRQGGGGTLTLKSAAEQEAAHADLVLECGPERLNAKQAIFADILSRTAATTVLASASSAIPISQTVPVTQAQRNCLVAHPANPPSVLRVIELVPGAGTSMDTIERAERLFRIAGFSTVTLKREIEGFVMNRLQGAVLREAYRLVDDGVASANEIDDVMRLSLGPRWALSGPFETAELNTPGGIRAHVERLGPAYKRMGEARGETVNWHEALVKTVEVDRRTSLAMKDIPARVAWRARAVAELVFARNRIAGEDDA